MSQDITPKIPIIPSATLPGGILDVSINPTESTPSGTMVQPKKVETVGGMQVGATTLVQGFGNDIFRISPQGIQLGGANFTDSPFRVDMQGNLVATSATISGAISASTIDIGGADTSSFHVDVDGNMWSGAATYNIATNPFAVSNGGVMRAVSGTIGGFTLGSTSIKDTADTFGLSSDVTGGNDVRLWAGASYANRATAPFRVYEDGSIGGTALTVSSIDLPDLVTADSFHVDNSGNMWIGATTYNQTTNPFAVSKAGVLRATSGVIGGWDISTTALSTGAFDTNGTMYFGTSGISLSNTFKVTSAGALTAVSGTIGGFTLGTSAMWAGVIKTANTVGIGNTGVIMDTAGLRGYDSTLGLTFNLPTDGSAPTFASGIISETIYEINTNAVMRTSSTVGDGTASSAGILINSTGIYGCEANQALAAANIRILADGSGYFSGTFNIGGTTITIDNSQDIQTYLDIIQTAGGGTLFLDVGTYTLTANITIPDGVNLEGVSRDDVIIDCGIYSIIMSGSNVYSTGTVTINNGDTTVVGSGTTWTVGMIGRNIFLDGQWYEITGRADNTHITIPTYEGINLAGATYVLATVNVNPKITKVTIQNSAGAALQSQYSDNPQLNDLSIYDSAIGIEMDYVTYPEILAYVIGNGINLDMNYITGAFINYSSFNNSTSGEGIKISNMQTSSIYNSTADNNTTVGISMTNCIDNTFFDMSFSGNTTNGASLTSCSKSAFVAISFNSNGAAGIEFISGNNDNQITDGNIQDNTTDGIKLTATSDRNSFCQLSILNNGGYGINIAASTCDNNQINSPAFDNNTSGDINDQGTATTIIGVSSLKITYTGIPNSPFMFPIVSNSIAIVPNVSAAGQQTYYASTGPTIFSFFYTEGNTITGNFITTLSFDDLVGVNASFAPQLMANITSLSLPVLKNVVGSFGPASMASLTTLSIPLLEYVGASFNPSTMASLTTLTTSSLKYVGNDFNVSTMASLTTLSFPALEETYNEFRFSGMASLTTISFPAFKKCNLLSCSTFASLTSFAINSLETVISSMFISSAASLTTISFSGLISVGTTINFSTTLGSVANVTLGTIGTLKKIGGNINISGQALTAATVNGILALLVSLDGTGGTTTWGTGKTVNLSGGTSSAPTGQGITDKATLQGRGATVTTN